MMTLGSLFDGIGGFPLAGIHNGITPLWASEIESFPIKVTQARFPDMAHVGDITKLDGGKLPPVDVICGGSPCQDLSVAGQRRGLAGERSSLFMDQVRIVKEMRNADARRGIPDHLSRPRYLVWENVPGAFSSANGEDFRAVIEEIVRIKDCTCHVPRPDSGRWEPAGAAILGTEFSLAWRVLDAQFWGVAQRRRRIFLVADFGGLTAPQILFKQDSLFGDPAEGESQGEGPAAAAERGVDDPGGWSRDMTEKGNCFCLNDQGGSRMDVTEDVTATLWAGMGSHPPLVAGQDSSVLCLNDQGGSQMHLTADVSGTLRAQEHGHQPLILANQQGRAYIGKGVCPTITAAAGTSGNNHPVLFEDPRIDANNNIPLVARTPESYCISGNIIDRQVQNGGNGLGCQEDIAYTLTATDKHAVFSTYQTVVGALCRGDEKGVGSQYVSQDKCVIGRSNRIRRLTPLECERLQGFPDGWTDIPGASDSARYKALGNSVAIPCVDFVLRGIAYFLQKAREESG